MKLCINPIIKLTESCNYSCYFCRYANCLEEIKEVTVENIEKWLGNIILFNLNNGYYQTDVTWHGGEPLLWGKKRFEQIIDFEEKLFLEYKVRIINHIQTNGYLIDNDWIELFKKHDFQIGVSIDGPQGLNGHFIGSMEINSFNKVINNLKLMQKNKIRHGIISVITNKHIGKEKEFYQFLVNNKIKNLNLCYCFDPDGNESVDPEKLGQFLIKLFDLYFDGEYRLNIREFNNSIRLLLNKKSICCTTQFRNKCGCYLTLEPDGNVMFCDDYTLKRPSSIGNLNKDTIATLLESDLYIENLARSKIILENRCKKCCVFNICRGGCARNDSNNSNYFCETYKILYSYIERKIQLYKNIKRNELWQK